MQLCTEGNLDKLRALFGKRMSFGTAGLRSAMGAGFSRMNDLTVIQATQGLCSYLMEEKSGSKVKVVIGYDGRHNSKRFATRAAAVFLAKGNEVILFHGGRGFSDIDPTLHLSQRPRRASPAPISSPTLRTHRRQTSAPRRTSPMPSQRIRVTLASW